MRHLVIPIAALLLVAYAMSVTGCRGAGETPVVVKTVTVPVITPCPDQRAPKADYPLTLADLKSRLAKEPDSVAKVQRLLSWAPLWMERLNESDAQIAVCAQSHAP